MIWTGVQSRIAHAALAGRLSSSLDHLRPVVVEAVDGQPTRQRSAAVSATGAPGPTGARPARCARCTLTTPCASRERGVSMAPAIIRFGPNACARHSSFPTPFCRLSKGGSAGRRAELVDDGRVEGLDGQDREIDLRGGNASARVVNGQRRRLSLAPGSTRRMPVLCATSTMEGRPTSVIRFPARASRAPMKEPTAPAPMIRICTGVRASHGCPSTVGVSATLTWPYAQDQLRP